MLSASKIIRPVISGALFLLTLPFASAQTTTSPYFFSHLAGPLGGPGNSDGPDTSARFFNPAGIAVDGAGNLYVGDRNNHTIRKISAAGIVTTLAGEVRQPGGTDGIGTAAQFAYPYGIAVDRAGNVFVADRNNHSIRKIAPNGAVSTFASKELNYGWADGTGSTAQFAFPDGLAIDAAGNLYVAENRAHGIRKITPDAVVTTLAGDSQSGFFSEQVPTWMDPYLSGIAVDSVGILYFADNGGHTIRKVTPNGKVTTLAGLAGQNGTADGIGSTARFNSPQGVAVDRTGNVYVADQFNHTIRKITPGGAVSTWAGTAGRAGSADGMGTTAEFDSPYGLTIDQTGNLFVSDWGNHTIRKITPTGLVITVAGMAGGTGTTDGTGTQVRFLHPSGLTVDSVGNTYVLDKHARAIRKISPAGVTQTVAHLGPPPTLGFYELVGLFMYVDSQPSGIAVDRDGNIFAVDSDAAPNDRICKITPDGVVTTLLRWTEWVYTYGLKSRSPSYMAPCGLAVDKTGNLYVADAANQSIRKISPGGEVTTVAGDDSYYKMDSAYAAGIGVKISYPLGLTVDSAGAVYVAQSYNQTISKIAPGGTVTTFAGKAGELGNADGTGADARFNFPTGVAVDNAGNVYVTDFYNQTIRKITSSGAVTTIGGTPGGVSTPYSRGEEGKFGSADGVGSTAQFCYPKSIAVDSAGQIYVADTENHAIRKGQLAGPPVITTQPLSQTVAPGATVQFSATAGGVPAPTYKWFFNGNVFSGATTSTLSFASARSADAGDYTVVVTNELGSVTSAKATLTISAAPVTPPSTTPPASAGGGSIESWSVLALLILGGTSRYRIWRNFLCDNARAIR